MNIYFWLLAISAALLVVGTAVTNHRVGYARGHTDGYLAAELHAEGVQAQRVSQLLAISAERAACLRVIDPDGSHSTHGVARASGS